MKGIRNTTLSDIEKLVDSEYADIYVKYAGANTTGSMKDRITPAMIDCTTRKVDFKKKEPSLTILEVEQEVHWQ